MYLVQYGQTRKQWKMHKILISNLFGEVLSEKIKHKIIYINCTIMEVFLSHSGGSALAAS